MAQSYPDSLKDRPSETTMYDDNGNDEFSVLIMLAIGFFCIFVVGAETVVRSLLKRR